MTGINQVWVADITCIRIITGFVYLAVILDVFSRREEVYLLEYESFTDVVERIPQFIEEVYNRKRVRSGIGYLPPAEFEDILKDERRKKELGQATLILAD